MKSSPFQNQGEPGKLRGKLTETNRTEQKTSPHKNQGRPGQTPRKTYGNQQNFINMANCGKPEEALSKAEGVLQKTMMTFNVKYTYLVRFRYMGGSELCKPLYSILHQMLYMHMPALQCQICIGSFMYRQRRQYTICIAIHLTLWNMMLYIACTAYCVKWPQELKAQYAKHPA